MKTFACRIKNLLLTDPHSSSVDGITGTLYGACEISGSTLEATRYTLLVVEVLTSTPETFCSFAPLASFVRVFARAWIHLNSCCVTRSDEFNARSNPHPQRETCWRCTRKREVVASLGRLSLQSCEYAV